MEIQGQKRYSGCNDNMLDPMAEYEIWQKNHDYKGGKSTILLDLPSSVFRI